MDLAPALPPAQDAVPVFVSRATDLPPASNVSARAQPAVLTVGPSSKTLPSALMSSVDSTDQGGALRGVSINFLSTSQLSRSFSFMTQAWQATRLASISGSPLIWENIRREDSTLSKHRALATDLLVEAVAVTAQAVYQEESQWSADFISQCMTDAQPAIRAGTHYRISLNGQTLGYVSDEAHAHLLAKQIKRLMSRNSFDPSTISPQILKQNRIAKSLGDRAPKIAVGTPDHSLFTIKRSMAEDLDYSAEWAAISWANNLRTAFGIAPLGPGETAMNLKNLEDSSLVIDGEASWYGPYFHGRATANGETYDQNDLTVAHKSLPFGTQLKVRNLMNDKTIVVRVNDRGPYVGDRILDLSKAAADCLSSDQVGVIPVEAIILKSR